MKQIYYIILMLTVVMVVSGCKKSRSSQSVAVERSLKPSKFSFLTTPDKKPYLFIENIGDISIKGSMPDKTTVFISKEAMSSNKKEAAEILDKISFNPVMEKDGKIKITPKYPNINEHQFAKTNLKVLIPLNANFPVNIGSAGGNISLQGIRSITKLKTSGNANIDFRAFKGIIEADINSGKLHMSDHIYGGHIKMKSGAIFLQQREKMPYKDLFITLEKGIIRLQLWHGIKSRITINAPKIENKSELKFKNNKYGKDGSAFVVTVKSGKVVILPCLW